MLEPLQYRSVLQVEDQQQFAVARVKLPAVMPPPEGEGKHYTLQYW